MLCSCLRTELRETLDLECLFSTHVGWMLDTWSIEHEPGNEVMLGRRDISGFGKSSYWFYVGHMCSGLLAPCSASGENHVTSRHPAWSAAIFSFLRLPTPIEAKPTRPWLSQRASWWPWWPRRWPLWCTQVKVLDITMDLPSALASLDLQK